MEFKKAFFFFMQIKFKTCFKFYVNLKMLENVPFATTQCKGLCRVIFKLENIAR